LERLSGSIRRELLDHVIVWIEQLLHRLLTSYISVYDGTTSLGKIVAAVYRWSKIGLSLLRSMPGGIHLGKIG
jgi:hypothetical protein